MKKIALRIVIFLLFTHSASAQHIQILVAAASSLMDTLTYLKKEAEQAVGAEILYNFGASGTLRRQIEEGAPVDLFISAAKEDMDRLENAGLVNPETRKEFLTNAIVLVGGNMSEKPRTIDELKSLLAATTLLAIGNPDSVPAGRYAIQALKSLGLYNIVEKKLVLGGSVRQVLQYVESGSAPLGIVFTTDVALTKKGNKVQRLYDFPEKSLATPIIYSVAVASKTKYKVEASKLIAYLQGKSARNAFIKMGFGTK